MFLDGYVELKYILDNVLYQWLYVSCTLVNKKLTLEQHDFIASFLKR